MHACKRALLLSALTWLVSSAAFAEDSVIGIWSALVRTKGGLGAQWVFTKEGGVTYTFGALVDFKYEIEGSRIKMTLLGADRSVTSEVSIEEFSIEGDTLIMNPRTKDKKQVMKRSGKLYQDVYSIVGDWTYTHYTGGPALMRYSKAGVVQLTVPFQSFTGTYHVNQGSISIELKDRKRVDNKFRRESNFLVLMEDEVKESKYIKFEY